MGTLLRHAPAPTATGVYHLETLNLETILMNSHKVSFAEPHRLWQAVLTGGVRYNRDKLRYPSDLTDAEWAHIEPLIPPGKPGGGKRRVAIREVINGVMYILSTGCQWRALPKDLPPRSTVHDYLGLWNWDGTLDRIHHALYLKCREKAAREASPTACIIDSQSVKSAEKGGLASTATASMPAS